MQAAWDKETEATWNDDPISLRRFFGEVYNAVKNEDWVLATGRPGRMAPGIWEFNNLRQFCGDSGGGGLGYGPGASVGVALGHRDTGKMVVAIDGDGDFLMAPQALAVDWPAPSGRLLATGTCPCGISWNSSWPRRG